MRFFRCQSKSIFPPLNWKEKFQTFKCHDDNKGPVAQPKKTKNKTKTFARTKCAWVVGSMCDFLKFKFTHVIRLRDLNRQFDQRGGKKNPEAKSRRSKTKTNFSRGLGKVVRKGLTQSKQFNEHKFHKLWLTSFYSFSGHSQRSKLFHPKCSPT